MKNTNASEKTAQVKLRKNVVSLMSSNPGQYFEYNKENL